MGTMIYHVENPAPGLEVGQAQNVVGLNQLMGSEPSPLDNWISNGNKYINKIYGHGQYNSRFSECL
jgi:hypothetical protein